MIMKRVEEECKAKITAMKPEYRDVHEKDRDFNALFFKVVFARGE